MILRMQAETFKWFQDHPQVWWSNRARNALGRLAPGLPGLESDPKTGELTGWVRFDDSQIDAWDIFIYDVCVAGMEYAKALGSDQARELVAYQAQKDAAALTTLVMKVEAGEMTLDDAVLAVKKEVIRQAGALKVPVPDMDDDLNIIIHAEEFDPGIKP